MQGSDVFENADQMPLLNAEEAYVAQDNDYPQLIVFTDLSPEEDTSPVPDYVWDGTTAKPAKGDGTRKNPYLIGTAEELAYVISNGGNGKYYKLTADIYLNDINKVNWTTGKATGDYEIRTWFDNVAFEGTINGDGHTVYGIYFKTREGATWGFTGQGLVPRVNPGKSVTISKLGVDYAYVSGPNGASAFVGFAGATSASDESTDNAIVTINKCFVGENVTLKGNDVGAFRGGTKNSVTKISNAYSLATLQGVSTGGIVGNIWGGTATITNVFNANGTISSEKWLPYFSMQNTYATDCGAYTGEVIVRTQQNMKGLDVFTNENKMPKLNADSAFIVTTGYPVINFEGEEVAVDAPVKGSGTKDDPYIISTVEELRYVVERASTKGNYYKLGNDIYVNNTKDPDWMNKNPVKWYSMP